ncbi:MAG: hypothetical protein ACK4MS_13015 [Paracoccaceae bacterium]
MTRFVVDLGDIDIPDDMRQTISEDLQKTVLAHVARLRLSDPLAIKFPKDWYGLIARKQLDHILDAEVILQKGLFAVRGMK